MFGCCRCTNPSKKENKIKKCKKHDQQNVNDEANESNIEIEVDHSKDIIEIRLKPDKTDETNNENENKQRQSSINNENDDNITTDKSNASNETNKVNNANNTTKNTSSTTIINSTNVCNKSDINNSNLIKNDEKNNLSNNLNKSNNNNATNEKFNINNLINNDANVPENTNNIKKKLSNLQHYDADDIEDTIIVNNKIIRKTSKDTILSDENDIELPKSCISRRSSSKSSIRKKVNINDSTEVIPSSELVSIDDDDDEVFSDSVPPKMPRGDMCAPYTAQQRGSLQGYFGFLPDWFNEERLYSTDEEGGILEPPVTPVGKDELALKRHRLYSDLLRAAEAAVEHRVRFDPLGPEFAIAEDCDPDLKPSVAAELEKQVNRLEKLVERLERSISAHHLDIANKVFNSVIETKRRSFDIETAELPPIPNNTTSITTATTTDCTSLLDKRIDRLEDNLNKINCIRKEDKNNISNNNCNYSNNKEELIGDDYNDDGEGSLENIPTVLDEYLIEENCSGGDTTTIKSIILELNNKEIINNMSVNGFEDIILGPLTQYLNVSNKIGGDVAKHSAFVSKAFEAQFAYIKLATQIAQPQQNKQMELLKPTSDQIAVIQDFREKNRTSQYFNHLSAISESIPALGWVCVSPTPGPHVKEMNDAGQFYTNRVLKDWKDKDPKHVEWARSWVQTLTELQKYIKQYHTTGLVWSGKGQAGGCVPPPPPSGCPPPPPPPVLDMSAMALGDDRSALFADINRGEDVTKGLRKVTSDMQTHKNPTLRTGPAPFKTPTPTSTTPTGVVATKPAAPVSKPPVFNKDGKKWIIEYQKSNPNLNIDNAEMNNVIYMFKCENSTLTVKGKVNSVFLDSCKKCSLVVDSVVASIEFVNCQSVQMQVLHKCPTISIDKTDGCQMYLSKESLDVAIISSKSSEMNVMIPKGNGDYVEQPIPEQYKTLVKGTSLHTTCVESLG